MDGDPFITILEQLNTNKSFKFPFLNLNSNSSPKWAFKRKPLQNGCKIHNKFKRICITSHRLREMVPIFVQVNSVAVIMIFL